MINGFEMFLSVKTTESPNWVAGQTEAGSQYGWVFDNDWTNPKCPTAVGYWEYYSTTLSGFVDAELTVSCASSKLESQIETWE